MPLKILNEENHAVFRTSNRTEIIFDTCNKIVVLEGLNKSE